MNRLITVLATVAALAGSALPAAAAAAGPPAPGHGGPAVTGWGSNLRGQLGTGHTGDDVLRPVLARLPHGTRITQVAPGCSHSLALTSTGSVLAWGDNRSGELGNGTTGGFKATPGIGWCLADTLANDEIHPYIKPFSLDRFVTGALVDEHGAAGVAH